MKRTLFLSILIIFFTISFLSIVGCNNQKDYDLQERCGKRSNEYFQNKYGNGTISDENEDSHSMYQFHYNKKKNKCFILTTTDGVIKNNNSTYYSRSLFGINENQEFGSFYMTKTYTICMMPGKTCRNSLEWDSLVKPYMEE